MASRKQRTTNTLARSITMNRPNITVRSHGQSPSKSISLGKVGTTGLLDRCAHDRLGKLYGDRSQPAAKCSIPH